MAASDTAIETILKTQAKRELTKNEKFLTSFT